MNILPILFLTLLFSGWQTSVLATDHSKYAGHKVYRIFPEKARHLTFLKALEGREVLESDFWTDVRGIGIAVDVQVAPKHQETLETALTDQRIPYSVTIQDLKSFLDEHTKDLGIGKNLQAAYDFTYYQNYTELMSWVDLKAAECGAQRCTVSIIGNSYEQRDLKLIKITNGDGVTKSGYWIDAGIHAREWIAPAVATYITERLIRDYGTDTETTVMLDNFDFYILTLVNPDGYEFTFTDDRMWRKSRRPNTDVNSPCIGTDINRNFGFQWGGVGSSDQPCSATYGGPSPYSESEADSQYRYITQTLAPGALQVFYTLHSYGQLWMTPWGYTVELPADYDKMYAAGLAGVNALQAVYGTNYTLGSAANVLYESSGTSRDWAKGDPQIEYVYTIELRDTGNYGFILPEDQIVPTGVETWEGMQAFAMHVLQNPAEK